MVSRESLRDRLSPGPASALGAVLVAAVLLAACSRSSRPPADRVSVPKGTPVVLISIDTLRSDHLPMYGYRGVATPALDSLRADAILYERAYSQEPLTLPSHTSIMTGRIPPAHGVRDNIGYRLDTAKTPTLAQELGKIGYRTGAAVSAFVLRGSSGISAGFDFYQDSIEFTTGGGLGGVQRPGAETLRLALPWLDRAAAEGPFFFFFHIYEPHTPYEPPEPFASRYQLPYDGEIATADRVVGDLLAELKRLGVYDRALLVLLADHGEGLGDHGEAEHGILLYRETLQVPLLLKLPHGQLAGTSTAVPAQLVDVFPTVAKLVGAPLPAKLDGTSLLDLLGPSPPERRIYSETFYPRIHFGWSDLASLIGDRFHYIEGPDPELYDLRADPAERDNVLPRERRTYASFKEAMAGYDRTLQAPGEADAETKRALAALGYLASGVRETGGPLLDPKSQLPTLKELTAGFHHFGQKDYRAAAADFRRALAENPQMVDAWEYLARSLQRTGHLEEATGAYKKALELSGGSPTLALSAASLYLEMGRFDEARSHARLALAETPAPAHALLAQIALRAKDLADAEKEARLASEGEPDRLGPRITLAEVLYARGKSEESLKEAQTVQADFARRKKKQTDLIEGLYLVEGKALAQLGRPEPAEAAFRREIELFPASHDAYTNLALLYALVGRGPEVGATLKAMVDADPTASAYGAAVKTLRVVGDRRSAASLLRYARGLFPGDKALAALEAG